MGSKAALALATVAGGSCGLDSLFARSLQPRNGAPVQPRNGAPVPEVTGTQQGCLSAQVPLRPLLLFSVTGNLIPARILFQFSSFAFCLYLCFTVTKTVFDSFSYWRRKWQPTPAFLPEESQGRGNLVGFRLWGRTESDTTEAT